MSWSDIELKRRLWLEEKIYDVGKPVVVCVTCGICHKICCINVLPDYRLGYYSREVLNNAKMRLYETAEAHIGRHIKNGEA